MCELFGANLLIETSLNGMLAEFFSHSVMHPHGWGLATFKPNSDIPNIIKEPIRAIDSQILKQTLLQDIHEHVVLGHIRYATIGKIESKNCHPYTYKDKFNRQWTLIHNGTIYADTTLLPYKSVQEGSSDSERVLLHIINKVNQHSSPLNACDRFHVLNNVVCELSYRNKLNLIVYDGELLYVHTNMKNTLYQKEINGNMFFATVPLDSDEWLPVPMTTLLAYQNGILMYRGTNHRNEFMDSYANIQQNQGYYI